MGNDLLLLKPLRHGTVNGQEGQDKSRLDPKHDRTMDFDP